MEDLLLHNALQERTGTVRYIETAQPFRTLMPQEHAPRTGRQQETENTEKEMEEDGEKDGY